ncbi:unnamed protein product [Prunus armeniaca]
MRQVVGKVHFLSIRCMFPSIPSIDNTNNATPEAIDADDAINNNSITSPTPLIRRPGAKQVQKDHSPSDIIGNVHDLCYVSLFEPKNVMNALVDNEWILAMQEELNQFKRNDVWYLVPRPKDSNVIGTK